MEAKGISLADFYAKYGDEVRARRMEMGEVMSRQLEHSDRSPHLSMAIGVVATCELLSAMLATLLPNKADRERMYPEIARMIQKDTEHLIEEHG